MNYSSLILISRQAVKKSNFSFWLNFEVFSRFFFILLVYIFLRLSLLPIFLLLLKE